MTTFDFVPHSGTFSKDILPLLNGGHTSVGALYDAPELLPLLERWATYCDNQRYGLRSLAEQAPAFVRSAGAPAHFARRIAEDASNKDWMIGQSLLGSDAHRDKVEPNMCAERGPRLGNYPLVYVLAAQAQLYPEVFAQRALAWLEQSQGEIRKWRRDSRHMNGPNEEWLHGLYAALALAPSLDAAIVKHLARRTKEAGALIALLRHGHAKTLERVRDPQTFIEIHNSGDYTYGAGALFVAMGDEGRKMLRELLLDPTSPVQRGNLIEAAVDLGIWDRDLTDAFFAATEANAPGAVYAATELPLLERDDVRRLEKVPGVPEQAIAWQRDTSKKPAAPWNNELWQLTTDALTARLSKLTSKDMLQLTGHVNGARRAGDRFAVAASELASSKNPVTQLVIRLAARPPQRYPALLARADHHAGLQLQELERRWRPERFAAQPSTGDAVTPPSRERRPRAKKPSAAAAAAAVVVD
jgi:hypothetical protein